MSECTADGQRRRVLSPWVRRWPIFAGCGATPIVMKNPRTDQVVVCDGGARAREVWAQTYADRCAEQLERDGWMRLTR
jgi:hypothetical protein